RHSGNDTVVPGQLIEGKIDWILCHEITTPAAVKMLEERGMDRVFDPSRIVAVPDHSVPAKDIKAAILYKRLKDWVARHGIEHFYDVGRGGIAHVVLEESGLVGPGEVLVSGDSHTCNAGALGMFATGIGSTDLAAAIYSGELWFKIPHTMRIELTGKLRPGVTAKDIALEVIKRIGADGANYKVMEWVGEGVAGLSMAERFTLTNMAIEAGGKTGIVPPDDVTRAHLRAQGVKETDWWYAQSDADAEYSDRLTVDLSTLEPVVAFPNIPSNGRAPGVDKVKVDQAYLGSCTNGRISDLRAAAAIMRGHKIADHVRMVVTPATVEIWRQANREGLIDIFMEAGATVSYPSCGACLGMHTGVLGPGDVCISSTNRNFVGRMGDPTSQVYLASPETVAISAITGYITDPREAVLAAQASQAAD
ncbi:MAG TPA: 3-isopropylmalate dehydratase large subunit, partial [Deinococcales bacterium]|nr:3-isopropylmalate dehydratase large subunit [Deinococcales bacterium]